jgi:hypothetical protein
MPSKSRVHLAWNGRRALVSLADAVVFDVAGRAVLAPSGTGLWHILDRSPLSVRLTRGDGAVCRFELTDDALECEILGGEWDRSGTKARLDAEIRDADLAAENRT